MEKIDITGVDKAKVLVALHNASKQQGLGFLEVNTGLSYEKAQLLLAKDTYFDYIGGKVMKVNLAGDSLDTYFYDRDNGQGAAYRALKNAGLVGV